MVIDHTGAVLYTDASWMRMVGRLAFPIFCFLLVEGYNHTKDQKRYLIRLGMFALISEVPFDWTLKGSLMDISHQNVFFTLFLGLCAMIIFDKQLKQTTDKLMGYLAGTAMALMLAVMAQMLQADYGYMGILMIMLFYVFKEDKVKALILVACLNIAWGVTNSGDLQTFNIIDGKQALAALSVVLIYYYNGQRGWKLKYLFYYFYPVHLLVLGGLAMI